MAVSETVFAWHGGGIVLLGEQSEGRWHLARSWRSADRLTDVRRWSFVNPARFVTQVRRLVWEAALDPSRANLAATAAADWVLLRTECHPSEG